MGEFVYAAFLMVIGGLLVFFTLVNDPKWDSLNKNQSEFTRCLSDGGTQAHCIEKYLLPNTGSEK